MGDSLEGEALLFWKKETKNFWTFGWAGTRLGAGVRRSQGIDEVFLVLFVHKKNNLAGILNPSPALCR